MRPKRGSARHRGHTKSSGAGTEIGKEHGARTEGTPVTDGFPGHHLGPGVQGHTVSEAGVAPDEGGGIHAEEGAGPDIVPQDCPGLKEGERAGGGIGADVGKGRNDSAWAKIGAEDFCLWVEQIGMAEIERRVRLVRDAFKGQKFLKLRWHEPAMSHLEGILSRAGRELAPVVEAAYRKGAIFCSWVESFSLEPWYEALEENDLRASDFIAARDMDAPLPWDHLEAGISPDFLRREWERARAEKITEDCRYGACRACGACDTRALPSRLPHASAPTDDGPLHRNRLIFAQRDQSAHEPHRDAEGRIICRERDKKPPQIAPELTVKAAQFRIWHSKTGGCAYLSQLELQALLERALRRARLPMSFSQGFHPLPLMSFGRALPVGVESRAEWFALTLREPLTATEVAERLRGVLPPGMEILHVESVDKSRRTEQAVRELNLRVDQMPPQGSVHDLEVRLERMDGEQKRLAEEISGLRGIMERVERQVDLLFRGHMKD